MLLRTALASNRSRSGPLRVLLLLGGVIVAIVVFGYRWQSTVLERQALNNLQTIATLKADAIARSLEGQRARTEILGQSPVLAEALPHGIQPPDEAAVQRARRFMHATVGVAKLDNLILLDAAGHVQLAAKPVRPNTSFWQQAAAAAASRHIRFLDFHTTQDGDNVELGFIGPVSAGPHQPVLGSIVLLISGQALLDPQLTTWPAANPAGRTLLIHRRGEDVVKLVSRPDGTLLVQHIPLAVAHFAAHALGGSFEPATGRNGLGVHFLAATAVLPMSRWLLVAAMNRDQALAEVTRLQIGSAALTVAALAVSILAVFFLEQRRRLQQVLAELAHDRALRERAEQLRLFIDKAPAGIAMFDTEMRYLAVSRRYLQDYRLAVGSPDELRGQSHYDVLPDLPPAWRAIHQRVLAGETLMAEEDEYQRADGGTEWLRWEMTPWRTPEGAIGGALLFAELITSRMRAEEALRVSEARFRHVVEASPNALVMSDGEGRIELVNRQAECIFGYSRDEMLQQPLEMLVPDRFRREHGAAHRAFMANLRPRVLGVERRVFGRRQDGSEVPVEVGLSRLTIAGQAHVLATIADLTARLEQEAALRRSEEQLRQAQKMEAVGNLTGGIAHDFNNLLGVIIGNLDLADAMPDKGEATADLLRDALDAALRAADLTRRLLAFARRQPLRLQRLVPNDIVANAVRLLSRMVGEDVSISVALGEDVWPVVIDPGQLEAALVNLASNARDAMPQGGRLVVATENRSLDRFWQAASLNVPPGDYVVITVSDTGAGMSPEVLKQIFEPFFTTKQAGKGTGLGLSIVFGFMKQSGGHVDVDSMPGAGTVFRLYLPRATDAPEESPSTTDDDALPRATGESILVVEDDDALRRTVSRQLSDLGYAVLSACDAGEALGLLDSTTVDLLLTDIVMPGPMDGCALADHVQSHRPEIRVVLTSGFTGGRETAGADGTRHSMRFLGKPYRTRDLAETIRAALDA